MARKVTGLLNLPPLTDVLALLPQQVGRKVLERTLPPGEVFRALWSNLQCRLRKKPWWSIIFGNAVTSNNLPSTFINPKKMMLCWLRKKWADLWFLRYSLALRWLRQNWTSCWTRIVNGANPRLIRLCLGNISGSEPQHESSPVVPTKWPLPSQKYEGHTLNISELRQENRWLMVIVYNY